MSPKTTQPATPLDADVEVHTDKRQVDTLGPEAPELVDDVNVNPPASGVVKYGFPFPAWVSEPIKLLFASLLVVIVFAGVGLVISFFPSNSDNPPPSSEGVLKIGGAPIEPGAHAPATGAPAIFLNKEQLAGIESDIDKLRLAIMPLKTSNTELQDQVKLMANTYKQEIASLRSILTNISDNTIPALVSADKQYAETLSDLRKYTNNNKRRIDQATKRKAESPPFAVISVDVWGTATSAVLALDGKSTLANIGDVRAGWRITDIIRPNCIYAVPVKGGKTIQICGAGNL